MHPATISAASAAAAVGKVRAKLRALSQSTLSERQVMSLKETQVPETVWVSRATFPAPKEDHLRQAVLAVIKRLGNGDERFDCPETVSVQVEWTGQRSSNEKENSRSQISEEAKFLKLMKNVSAPMTILYVHGGAHYLNGSASCRPTVSRLSMLTGARCLSIQYRLAPQYPFPAALLDIMLVYLNLLDPAPGSYHDPIEASSIVLAGDSAGASLCLSLIQIILELKKKPIMHPSIRFHNRNVAVQMPAGITLLSVAGDMTQALPSWMENGTYDILRDVPPTSQSGFPKDSIWPSDPPRTEPYCHDSALCHPLVAPATAVSWAGAPPMWIACGQERLADGAKIIAQTAARDGVRVLWEEYQSMPHTWAQIFPRWPQSIHCFESWAQACKQFGEGGDIPRESYGRYIKVEDGKTEIISVQELTSLTPAKALEAMIEKLREKQQVRGDKGIKASL